MPHNEYISGTVQAMVTGDDVLRYLKNCKDRMLLVQFLRAIALRLTPEDCTELLEYLTPAEPGTVLFFELVKQLHDLELMRSGRGKDKEARTAAG